MKHTVKQARKEEKKRNMWWKKNLSNGNGSNRVIKTDDERTDLVLSCLMWNA